MGTWGPDTFDNDGACDWAGEWDQTADLSKVKEALDLVTGNTEDYLDLDDGLIGLAACEVVARLKGNWGTQSSFTETMDNWVKKHPQIPTAGLVQQALAVIDRVLAPESELADVWDEVGAADWQAKVADLRRRVGS
jgi:hypothetical protein